jgi:recombination protein RecT
MNTAVKQSIVPMIEIRDQLQARAQEFAHALPSHIKPEHFQRAALTAVQQNSKLLDVDRRSLINALMRCAGDGLLPDGRQAALVIFRDRERGSVAQYMPMVAGIRKLVQQSGEITRFEQTVVYENDKFECALGDRPYLRHRPAFENRGAAVLVYSIAQYNDGTLSREIMTLSEIDKVRQVSRSKDGGPWTEWWEEMAKKTIAKRHAKILPMSNDTAAVLARDDAEHFELPAAAAPVSQLSQTRPRLADQLDAMSSPPATSDDRSPAEKRKRGRPKKADEVDEAEIDRQQDDQSLGTFPVDDPTLDGQPDLLGNGDDVPDFYRGKADAELGRKACLDSNIRDDEARFADWQRGYDSVQKK